MSTFGQNVVKARVEKRWKQKDLQAATKLSQRFLSEVEHDKVDPRLSIVRLIAKALGLPVCRLVEDDGE
jgi:transcriptional regulator with XRE-family HTH domain